MSIQKSWSDRCENKSHCHNRTPFDANYGFALKTFPVQSIQYTVYMVSAELGPQSLQQDIE